MVRRKFWWMEQTDDGIYIKTHSTRSPEPESGKLITQRNGKQCSSVKSVSAYCLPASSSSENTPSTSAAENMQDDIKVVFNDLMDRPRLLSSIQFLWNVNNFSRLFKPKPHSMSTVGDFVTCFRACTDYDFDTSLESSEETHLEPDSQDNMDSSGDGRGDDKTPAASQSGGKKRKLEDIAVTPLLKKRSGPAQPASSTPVTNPFKEEIENAFLGHVKISLQNLEVGKQIRPVNDIFVNKLQKEMEYFSNHTYQPLVVVTKTLQNKGMFSEAKANGFKYIIVGGQHNFLASTAMHKLHPEEDLYKTRWCSIYHHASLSSEATLALANVHNGISKFHHKMTFNNMVQMCHEIKRETAGKGDWKTTSCKILKKDKNSHEMRSILFLANKEGSLFHLVSQALNMFEKAELKSQKLQSRELADGVPQIKPSTFRPFFSIPELAMRTMLRQLIEKKISIQEFRIEGETINKLQWVQRSIVVLLDAKSWNEVEGRFPESCSRKVIHQFVSTKRNKLPMNEELRNFCRMLKAQEDQTFEEQSFRRDAPYKGAADTIGFSLQMMPMDLTAERMTHLCKKFSGFHLSILDMPKEWTGTELKSFLATVTSVNLSSDLDNFTVVVICEVAEMTLVRQCLEETQQFEMTTNCYYHLTNMKSRHNLLTNAIYGLMMAHHQSPTQLKWANGTTHNLLTFQKDKPFKDDDGREVDGNQKPVHLYKQLICTLTTPQQWVFDACCRTGTGMLASLAEGRNCVSAEPDGSRLFHLQARYNQQMGKKSKKNVAEEEEDNEDEEDEEVVEEVEETQTEQEWGFDVTMEQEIVELSEMQPLIHMKVNA